VSPSVYHSYLLTLRMASAPASSSGKITNSKLSFRKRHPTFVRVVLLVFTFLVALGAGAAYGTWALICRGTQCPSIEILAEYTPHQTSKLYAIDGRFIAELGLERRTLVKIDEIPKIVQDAFVATEDKRFYQHAGIDWHRAVGVVLRSPLHGYSQGFSTITMQLARNVFPEKISREKSIVRKIKEAKVARAIEAKYDKKKILELYLNQIDLGHGAYGVETAAQRYFGKSVRDLNLAEAATLAALPKAPARYNPVRFPERAIQRRNTVLGLMHGAGYISEADMSRARAYPLQLANKTVTGETAPYFVEWVRQQLDAQFGKQLYEQGLKVYTTLDLDMQGAAERALERQAKAIEAGRFGPYQHETYEHYMAHREGDEGTGTSPYLQGAFLAMDPRTGAVRAMIGGRDFDDSKFNRAVQAQRQPGSSFKPFVYLAAMDAGFTPSTIVEDAPFEYAPGYGQPVWRPSNYGGGFLGALTVRNGLEKSRNLMTVRMANQMGMKRVVQVAREFGIMDNMGAYLPMALGAGDTTLLRMTMGHAMLANGAREITPSLIDRVQDRNGKTVYRHEPRECIACGEAAGGGKPVPPQIVDKRQPFHDPASVYQVVNMMLGVTTRGTAAQLAALGRPIAGKTGTTNDSRDNWFIGSTPDYTIGIYVGFDEPRTLGDQETGGGTSAPVYERIARVIFKDKPPVPFRIPPGVRIVRVDHDSGLPSSGGNSIDEAFRPGSEPNEYGAQGPKTAGTGATVAGDQPWDPNAVGYTGGGGGGGRPRPGLSGTGETY